MNRKPKGPKYRNLSARDGAIYYERVWNGRRYCRSTKTTDWDEAAAVRDLYEERKGIGSTVPILHAPTFEEFSKRYLEEDTTHLAPLTLHDRKAVLEGRLTKHLGAKRLDEITAADLHAYWTAEIDGIGEGRKRPRATITGRHDIDAVAAVLQYARELGLVGDADPVAAFRQVLRRRSRGQRGRAASEASRLIRPVEDPAELVRLVGAAREEGERAHLLVLLLLDAGLRLGEALALRWGNVAWGADENDRRRSLLVEASASRGGPIGPTKSGRSRRVGLARRLWRVLRAEHRRQFEPGPATLILEGFDQANFRHRDWRRILKVAGVAGVRMKDLRDTFASYLRSAGAPLGYVSKQLGHSDVSVTARHYAAWVAEDEYRDPVHLDADELPADVLAKIAVPTEVPRVDDGEPEGGDVTTRADWSERRVSNPRPSAWERRRRPRNDARLRIRAADGCYRALLGGIRVAETGPDGTGHTQIGVGGESRVSIRTAWTRRTHRMPQDAGSGSSSTREH